MTEIFKLMDADSNTLLENVRAFIFITLGAVIFAFGLEAVLIPNNVIDGGVVGISIMIKELTGLNLGILLFGLNIPFLILGYKQLGLTFAIRATYGIAVLSLSTKLLHHTPMITSDALVATILGGAIIGAGIGIVIKNGGVLDGTETLALLISKKIPFSVGQIILFVNVIIFSIAVYVFNLDTALYSMLAYFIAFKTIDFVEKGFNEERSIQIVTEEYERMGEAIHKYLGRGVTYINATGAYTDEPRTIVWCVITRLEESKIINIASKIDKDAFLVVSDTTAVLGGRFKKKDIH